MLVVHGAAEHSGRYGRFAEALNAAGYAVYAPDLRGHGRTGALRLGDAARGAWDGTIADLQHLTARIRSVHAGVPFVLFGHSRGSALAQRAIQLYGASFSGAILSGTFGSVASLAQLVKIGSILARVAPRTGSPLLGSTFRRYNAPFAKEGAHAWLTRDREEADRYGTDPLLGFALSNRLVADDARGWMTMWDPENEARVPADLPILLFAGEDDPVGSNTAGVKALAARYRENGVRDVTEVYYPGGRHEMLNEINAREVEQDVIAWIERHASR